MGVLVRQDQSKPVIGIPDGVVARRSRRIDLDRVEWHRCGPSVGEVVLIDQNHMHAAVGRSDLPRHAREHVFGNRGQPSREIALALVKVDGEVGRADGAKAKARIVPVGRPCRRATDDEQHQREERVTNRGHEPEWLPFDCR